jgi:hypothetical protein
MLSSLVTRLFGCHHRRKSFPITPKAEELTTTPTYVTCLDCGAEFEYDWGAMRLGRARLSHLKSPGTFSDQASVPAAARSLARAVESR